MKPTFHQQEEARSRQQENDRRRKQEANDRRSRQDLQRQQVNRRRAEEFQRNLLKDSQRRKKQKLEKKQQAEDGLRQRQKLTERHWPEGSLAHVEENASDIPDSPLARTQRPTVAAQSYIHDDTHPLRALFTFVLWCALTVIVVWFAGSALRSSTVAIIVLAIGLVWTAIRVKSAWQGN